MIVYRGSRTTRKLSSLAIYSEDNDDISDLTTGLENTSEYGECSSSSVSDKDTMDNVSESHLCDALSVDVCINFYFYLQSDNNSDVDKPKDVQDKKKKTEDVFNNNNNLKNNNNNNNLHSTALIKDVIHKKPVLQSREVKTEMSDVMTARVATSIYTMSTLTTSTTTTNEYTYDDAIEDYKSRVSRAVNPVQQPFSGTTPMAAKLDVPKVDIWKRRELFESQSDNSNNSNNINNLSGNSKVGGAGGEITSIKDRISSLKSNLVTQAAPMAPRKVELPTSTKLKDRLSSLQSSVSVVSEVEQQQNQRPIVLQFRNVQEVKSEFEQQNVMKGIAPAGLLIADDNESLDTDREDSGIHTTDVSCSVSQADQFDEQQIDEFSIVEERVMKLNAAAKVMATKECNVVQPTMAAAQIYEESIDMDQIDDESSVSYSESEGQSIVEGKSCDDNEHTNTNINNISNGNGNGNSNGNEVNVMNEMEEYEENVAPELTKNPPPSPGVSTSIFEFIHCNLLKSNTDDNLMIIEEHTYDSDTDLDNNYVYECIKINKRNGNDQHLKCNGLEKSNSIDTALSLCSSSEMESFMEDNDTEKLSITR